MSLSTFKTKLLSIVDSRLANMVRSAGLLAFALISFVTCILSAPQMPIKIDLDPITIEHRFTMLETKVDQIVADTTEMKYLEWLKMLGLAGLLGEAGIRIVKKG